MGTRSFVPSSLFRHRYSRGEGGRYFNRVLSHFGAKGRGLLQSVTVADGLAKLYLDLLKKRLLRWGEGSFEHYAGGQTGWRHHLLQAADAIAKRAGWQIVKFKPFDPKLRMEGLDWPWPASAE